MKNKNVIFVKGKKKREELRLPILHYIVADDWIDKLGHESFTTWLKFHTWCDRSDQRKDPDNDVIPYSLNKVAEKLGVSKTKLYRLIKPLWNYGLIDLIEYEDSKSKGSKPINIVVYDYPQNNKNLETKPLIKIRDYDKDYSSNEKTFAKRGGRPKKTTDENESLGGFKNETANISSGGFKNETEGVSEIKPRGVSNSKPNNISNNIIKESNIYNNETNNLSINKNEENKNISFLNKNDRQIDVLINEIKTLNIPTIIKEILLNNADRIFYDEIHLKKVVLNFEANKDKLTIEKYAEILNRVLEKTEKKINDIGNLMNAAIKNEIRSFNLNKPNKVVKSIGSKSVEEQENGITDDEYSVEEYQKLKDKVKELKKLLNEENKEEYIIN